MVPKDIQLIIYLNNESVFKLNELSSPSDSDLLQHQRFFFGSDFSSSSGTVWRESRANARPNHRVWNMQQNHTGKRRAPALCLENIEFT